MTKASFLSSLLGLALLGAALAAAPAPVPPTPTETVTVPSGVVNVPATLAKPSVVPPRLADVEARLEAASAKAGKLKLTLTLNSQKATDILLETNRDNEQNCAFAPTVRLLKVGTREVVYPSGAPRICAQDLQTDRLSAGKSVTFGRTLDLPAGEYMVEGWWTGVASGAGLTAARARVPAQPIRVTVR